MANVKRAGAALLALLLLLAGTCCVGTPPAAADVSKASTFLEAFEPILREHVAGRPVAVDSDRRAALLELLEGWIPAAEAMPPDDDGFRDAEVSTARVLGPHVRDALEGRPFVRELEAAVVLKLATWRERIEVELRGQ